MTSSEIDEVLADIALHPRETWERLVRARFARDTQLAHHALLWLAIDDDPAHEPNLGDDSERYQLIRPLDRGATASVWQALDRKLARNVAIKFFHEERSPALSAILAEARAACEVVSDHVVRVYDVHEDDPAFIVMELVGEHDWGAAFVPAASAASCKPRNLREAVRWIRDIALGVQDAHLRNVFHRDLKPQNVLITPVSYRARISDFGLAVSPQTFATRTDAGLVVTGPHGATRIAGTPEYMSPEQAGGLPTPLDPLDPDQRAMLVANDVWGLGAIACHVLGGVAPWRGDDSNEPWEIAASGASPRIPHTTFEGRRLPRSLRRILERALELDPSDRYGAAQDFADELDAYLVMRPTTMDRSAVTRLWLWTRRNPQLSITLAMVAVLGSMLTLSYAAATRLRSDRTELARDIERARAEQERVVDELGETEAELRARTLALRRLQRTFTEAQEDYQTLLAARDTALRDADAATKKLATELDAVRDDRTNAEAARDLYERFWSRARKEADDVARERDTFKKDRERLRDERDKAVKDREAARTARAQAERQRDLAEADRHRAVTARRKLEAELLRLASELTSIQAGRSTASDSGSGSTVLVDDRRDNERERENTKRVNAGP